MASKTDICNIAISHLGISKEISNVTTEQSKEAQACRRFYDEARKAVLNDYPWPFATRFVNLGLVEEDPTTEWAYSYRYPVDCLYVRRILSGFRDDTEATKVVYKILQDDQGLLIYTDQQDAEIEYTKDEESADLFPSDFVIALSYRLAHYIGPRLTAGDPFNLSDKAMQKYEIEISKASANKFNEDNSSTRQDTESIAARD